MVGHRPSDDTRSISTATERVLYSVVARAVLSGTGVSRVASVREAERGAYGSNQLILRTSSHRVV